MGVRKTWRNASFSFKSFIKQYLKEGDKFHNHVSRETGDETQILFLGVDTKKQFEGL
jgi:hypothetical protein